MNWNSLMRSILVVAALAGIAYPAEGQRQAWAVRYSGPSVGDDRPAAITVDAAGNVYVTGESLNWAAGSASIDFATVKYDQNGNQLWAKLYDGDSRDIPSAIAVDSAGNVYVTGTSRRPTGLDDYATVKYDSDGNEQWVRTHNGSYGHLDFARALALDGSGNIYVTGTTSESGSGNDFTTIKYSPTGDVIWVRLYASDDPAAPGVSNDDAAAITIGSDGRVFVTGSSYQSHPTGGWHRDYTTVAYDGDGNQLWTQTFDGGYMDNAVAIAVGPEGSVIVTGSSVGMWTSLDIATVAYDSAGRLQWASRYSGPENSVDVPAGLVVDSSGRTTVTGSSFGSAAEFVTVQYGARGAQRWVALHPGSVFPCSAGIAPAPDGGVFVTGSSFGYLDAQSDFTTIRYDAEGSVNWLRQHSSSLSWQADIAVGIVSDAAGNVYVTGSSPYIYNDYATVKYTHNNAPIAVADTAVTLVETPITIDVLANDYDPDGDPLRMATASLPKNGSLVRNADNTWTFTPGIDFKGTDSFRYLITDDQTGWTWGTVTIKVLPRNLAPVAMPDTVATPQGVPIVIDVLANDWDPEGGPLSLVSVVASNHPGGFVELVEGRIRFTPENGFWGEATFTYTIADGNGATATGRVVVAVR